MASCAEHPLKLERPKSLRQLSIKLPCELVDDLNESRFLHHPPKTLSEVIKDRCEMGGIIRMGSRLGFYRLREIEKNL